jgi:hypothetical protein
MVFFAEEKSMAGRRPLQRCPSAVRLCGQAERTRRCMMHAWLIWLQQACKSRSTIAALACALALDCTGRLFSCCKDFSSMQPTVVPC